MNFKVKLSKFPISSSTEEDAGPTFYQLLKHQTMSKYGPEEFFSHSTFPRYPVRTSPYNPPTRILERGGTIVTHRPIQVDTGIDSSPEFLDESRMIEVD